jgi:hypothetical protein
MNHAQDPDSAQPAALCGDPDPQAISAGIEGVTCPACLVITNAVPDRKDGREDLLLRIRADAVRSVAQTFRDIAQCLETGGLDDAGTRQALQIARVKTVGTQRLLAAAKGDLQEESAPRHRRRLGLGMGAPEDAFRAQLAAGIDVATRAHSLQALTSAYAAAQSVNDSDLATRLRGMIDTAVPVLPLAPAPVDSGLGAPSPDDDFEEA